MNNMELDIETKGEALRKLFIEQLKDLYDAESQLVKALPRMVKAAFSSELKAAFDEHLQLTQEHVNRIERILSELDEKPTRIKCEGMKGLVIEGEEVMRKREDDPLIRDAGLIAAAQKVEHYEIAGYGTVRTYAEMLGFNEAAETLQQTLDEEGEADKTLTAISENLITNGDNRGG
jgi:ferritin-like metal-binding protein YciE